MVVMIVKVHPEKESTSEAGAYYIQVDFVDHYDNRIKYKTYLNKENNNFKNWKGFRKGCILSNCELREDSDNIIDADSKPILSGYKNLNTQGDLFDENT